MDHVVMAENGRLVVPAQLRQALGMARGGKMVASVRDGALVLEPFDTAMQRVRDVARRYVESGKSVVDELLSERRQDAARDDVP
jgi:bifunctional DNA-binding transcriptional regulator/antitoxin component of YhaV-PrlF toxin-antitoxin module